MLAKRIIPCLDVTAGRVVKGVQFENLRDAGDPLELARYYVAERADELVFLDITASRDKRAIVYKLIERLAEEVFIPFTIGGGLKSIRDIREVLMRGADKVSLNTAAVLQPDLIAQAAARFGSQCVVIAMDVKRVAADRLEIFTHGGSKPTGIESHFWARKVTELGAGEILLTSMDRDGKKTGYDLEITRSISESVNVPVIASGGGGELHHFQEVFSKGKADAALAASIFHFRQFRISEVKNFLSESGIPVRN